MLWGGASGSNLIDREKGDGVLVRGGVQGGGGQRRRHLGGRWYGGRWHDDGNVVGDSGPRETADPPYLSSLLSTLAGLPYPSQAASWRNGNPNGSGKTPTTAPKPPHTTSPNPWGRGRDMSASAPCSLNALETQAWWAKPGGWRRRGNRCVAQVWQGTTPLTPTVWPMDCAAWRAINRRRVGTTVRRGAEDLIGVATPGAPTGARSFASDRGRRRLGMEEGFSEKLGGGTCEGT